MRHYLLALGIFAAGCGDETSTTTTNDLSVVGAGDMAMNMMMTGDMAVPDLAIGPGIAGVRGAADRMLPDGGTGSMVSIPVENVVVTYVKAFAMPSFDSAGFFVQDTQTGPALFVAVDPATLPAPGVKVGDRVSFTVTAVWRDANLRQATAIDNFMVVSSGFDVETLRQDLSGAADLVTGIDNYESELATVSGTVAAGFTAAQSYVVANFTTMGVPMMTNALKLRMPSTVRDSLDVTPGCTLTVKAPLWRFFGVAEPTAWVDADVSNLVCPAPKVVSAKATSPTTVVVTFDRALDPSTVDTGSFSFTNGLTAQSIVVSGNTVTITTSAQTTGQLYTVTVATTVTDKAGTAIDMNARAASFNGYAPPAVLIITELNPSITGGRDLVELKALTGGNLDGFKIYQDTNPASRQLLTTLPDLVVAMGDIVLVHLNPVAGITAETNSQGKSACTNSDCRNAAWDVRATTVEGLGYSGHSVSLVHPDNTIKDAMVFYRSGGGITLPAGFAADVKYMVDNGLWAETCPNACATNANAITIAVDGEINQGIQSSVTGRSMKRLNDTIPSKESFWTVGANSWGAP